MFARPTAFQTNCIFKIAAVVAMTVGMLGCSSQTRPKQYSYSHAGIIVEAQSVALRKAGWKDTLPTGIGSWVSNGDSVQVGKGGHLVIMCALNEGWTDAPVVYEPTATPQRVTCADRPQRDTLSDTMRIDEQATAWLLEPNNTAVLSGTRPMLRWRSAAETNVLTMGCDNGITGASVERNGHETAWPENWPAFMASSKCWIDITEKAKPKTDTSYRTHFPIQVLSEDQRDKLNQQLSTLQSLLRGDAYTLVAAETHMNFGLRLDAAQKLEEIGVRLQEPHVLLSAGRLWQQMGDDVKAKQMIQQALDAAQRQGHRDAEADALDLLGERAKAAEINAEIYEPDMAPPTSTALAKVP